LPRQERAAKLFCQPDSYAMDAEDLRTYREAMAAGPLRALLGGYARLARAAR
jgi:hypothetical protein